ncbi:MAG: ATP-dependent RecD-like DNA helicase [Oscillospiraceae bacterium]|nr:ATP-dependent RecD-like DNA helicase [Oscillospiraceae bacterium]
MDDLKKLTGIVENVVFKNSSNGYIVFSLDCDGFPNMVIGNLGEVTVGEKLSLSGGFIKSPKYGEQFKAVTCERIAPETPEEIAKYLGSGIIPGIGGKTAARIVERFGEDTLEIIQNNPERLREIKGFSMKTAIEAGAALRRMCGVNNLLEFLSGFGVSPATSVAVWNRYDSSSIALIKKNPFLLCEQGLELDFDTADKMAWEFGIEQGNLERVKAGIVYSLSENAKIGHTCLPLETLNDRVCEFLQVSQDVFVAALNAAISEKILNVHPSQKQEWVYLSMYYKAETYISRKINQMLKMNSGANRDFSRDIAKVESEESITYEALQKSAIQGCLENNLFILTGGPGTGKTTTLNAIIRLLKQERKTLSLAAPTGRAAKRMSELTGEPACTIHRLLEVDSAKESDFKSGPTIFKKNEDNPLNADVIVIDEMSMVDVLLFESLLRAVKPDTKLIMVGDSDQLPSVGAGNVLADLIDCKQIEGVRLTEIFRQASTSLIVTNAHKIVSGEIPELEGKDKDSDFFFMSGGDSYNSGGQIARIVTGLVKTRLPAAYGFDPIDDIQVLTPTKLGPAGTRELNKVLQSALNPPSLKKKEVKFGDIVFRVGDKIMQTVNDYNIEWKKAGESGMGVFNGDIGIITGIDGYSSTSGGMTVNFDGRVAVIEPQSFNKIEHAYAITVHKSQGSEYKAVIMPLPSASKRLLYRSLLYTGVTRARDLLILVGSKETVCEMVYNVQKSVKLSCLKDMLISG